MSAKNIIEFEAAKDVHQHKRKEERMEAMQQRFASYLPEKKLSRQQRRALLRKAKKGKK